MVKLETWRGGWAKGQRRRRLSLYAEFLHGAGMDFDCILGALHKMAANCRPAYPSDCNDMPLRVIAIEAHKGYKAHSNAHLCECLNITPELARELDLLSIVPDEVREERKPPAGGERERARLARLDFARHYLANGGKPTARKLCAACVAAGYNSNRQTANTDLAALGLHARPVHLGRPKKEMQLELLGT
jgi:hypothetical protein